MFNSQSQSQKNSPPSKGLRLYLCSSVIGGLLAVNAAAAWAAPPITTNNANQDTPPAPVVAPTNGELIEQPIIPGTANVGARTNGFSPFGFLNTQGRSANLLGDMWGFRTLLGKYGMTLSVVETSEVLGNVSGGTRQGFDYEGLTTATLQMDTQRAFGLYGGLVNVSGLQVHGRNLSADNLGTLQTASGIEADRSTRLWEAWYQQKFLDDKLDIKVGQQSLDQEFMVSPNGLYFVNTMFGWPMLPSADMPGGGPAYPLSDLGLRVRAHPVDGITVLAGIFNGSPTKNNIGDPQRNDWTGTSFPVNGGPLAIAEIQFAYPSAGTLVKADETEPLARTYRLGVWYDGEKFADQRYDNTGLSLANPNSNGIAQQHRGDYAIYGVLDQMLWRQYNDPDRNINFFLRPMIAPQQNRNLINFSLNAGLTMHEPIFPRDDDTFGIGMGFARVSKSVTGLDQDSALYDPNNLNAIRHNETFVEATYQYQVTPWWQIQPDIQYVFHPGAGIVNPNNLTQKVKNETVLGVRTNITF